MADRSRFPQKLWEDQEGPLLNRLAPIPEREQPLAAMQNLLASQGLATDSGDGQDWPLGHSYSSQFQPPHSMQGDIPSVPGETGSAGLHLSPCRPKVGGRVHRQYQRCHDPESLRTGTQLQLLILGLLEIIHHRYSIQLPQLPQFHMHNISEWPTSIQAR